jgi:catechol 2,3-dioxygenase-like lactoylglutathione lyase family enzyme
MTTTFRVAMLVCADLQRSRDFYRDVLGLKLRLDESPDSAEFHIADGSVLLLLPKSELLAVRPGSMQLGFEVENVDRFVAGCAGRNVPVFQDPCDEQRARVAVIGDPDGYPIQLSSVRRKKPH